MLLVWVDANARLGESSYNEITRSCAIKSSHGLATCGARIAVAGRIQRQWVLVLIQQPAEPGDALLRQKLPFGPRRGDNPEQLQRVIRDPRRLMNLEVSRDTWN